MEILFLSNLQQNTIDPTGQARNHLKRISGAAHPNPHPRYWRSNPFEYLDARRRALPSSHKLKHQLYYDYCEEIRGKCAPQGGCIGIDKLREILLGYYQYTSSKNVLPSDHPLMVGRDLLIRDIKAKLSLVGYPQPCFVQHEVASAGLPTMGTKGQYHSETYGMQPYRHAYPALPGTRFMRNKPRAIFMQSVQNNVLVENELTACRYWLRENLPEYFASWLNPKLILKPSLTKALRKKSSYVVESDYDSMDQRFTWNVVQQIILPIYDVLLAPAPYLWAAAVEELFHNPLFMGSYLITGEHSLFSGDAFTNDFETIYSVCLALGTAAKHNQLNNIVFLAALGDDIIIVLKDKFDLLSRMREYSSDIGMLIHGLGKSRQGYFYEVGGRYLREVYYQAGRPDETNTYLLGAYPTDFAINNSYNPEFPQDSLQLDAVAILQRADGCAGSPDYGILVEALRDTLNVDLIELALDAYNQGLKPKKKDWWKKLYGEEFNPFTSPTFNKLKLITNK